MDVKDAGKLAGRLGGLVTRYRYGLAHYRRIGSLGAKVIAAKYGRAFYVEIGKKGGRRTAELVAAGKAAKGEV